MIRSFYLLLLLVRMSDLPLAYFHPHWKNLSLLVTNREIFETRVRTVKVRQYTCTIIQNVFTFQYYYLYLVQCKITVSVNVECVKDVLQLFRVKVQLAVPQAPQHISFSYESLALLVTGFKKALAVESIHFDMHYNFLACIFRFIVQCYLIPHSRIKRHKKAFYEIITSLTFRCVSP